MMRKTLLAAMAIMLALAHGPVQAQSPFRPVAIVNDSAITGYELDQRAKLLVMLGYRGQDKDMVMNEALDRLIDDRLKVQEATRFGITASEEQIQEAIQNISQRSNMTPEKLLSGVKARGVSEQTLRDMITADVVWQQMVRSRFNRRIDPGEGEIDAELAVMQQRIGTSYRLAEIGLPATGNGRTAAETQALANELYQSLSQGGDFAAAVKRYSRSPSAQRGGDVGWVPSNKLPPELLNELSRMQPGQVAPPFPVAGGMSLLKLVDMRQDTAATAGADETEMRKRVTRQLQNERGTRLAEGLLQELRRDALIEMR